MRIGPLTTALVVTAVLGLPSRGSAGEQFFTDPAAWLAAASDVRVIDFETLPDGSSSHGVSTVIDALYNYDAQGASFEGEDCSWTYVADGVLDAFCYQNLDRGAGYYNYIARLVSPATAAAWFPEGGAFPVRCGPATCTQLRIRGFDADGVMVFEHIEPVDGAPVSFFGVVTDTPLLRVDAFLTPPDCFIPPFCDLGTPWGLEAFGFTPPQPAPALEPVAPLLFGEVAVGAASEATAVVRNAGSADLVVDSLALTGVPGCAGYEVDTTQLPLTVAPGGEAGVAVRFSPVAGGWYACTLVLSTNDALRPEADVALDGVGVHTDRPGDRLVVPSAASGGLFEMDVHSGLWRALSCAACKPAVGGGPALLGPTDVAVAADGALLVADPELGALVRVDPATGDRSVLSCAGPACPAAVGLGPEIRPRGVDRDGPDHAVVIAGHGTATEMALYRIDLATGDRSHVFELNRSNGSARGVAVDRAGGILFGDYLGSDINNPRLLRLAPGAAAPVGRSELSGRFRSLVIEPHLGSVIAQSTFSWPTTRIDLTTGDVELVDELWNQARGIAMRDDGSAFWVAEARIPGGGTADQLSRIYRLGPGDDLPILISSAFLVPEEPVIGGGVDIDLPGGVALLPAPSDLSCRVAVDAARVRDGDRVVASSIRVTHAGGAARPVAVSIRMTVPEDVGREIAVAEIGATGDVVLPGGFDRELGPVDVVTITQGLPRGRYRLACLLQDPETHATLASDYAWWNVD